jgi:hypothetical protein
MLNDSSYLYAEQWKKLISSLMLNLRVFDIENTYTGVMNYFLISLHKW